MKNSTEKRFSFSSSLFILLNICIAHHISMMSVNALVFEGEGQRMHHHRRILSYNGDSLAIEPILDFENPRIRNAYIALQAWKKAMVSDPKNITGSWTGSNVCNYTGVFCWQAPDDPAEVTVAGIDINHCDIAGSLVHELGLLYDISFFHINSNRFCGQLPQSLVNLKLLFELDLSNNRFAGKFPQLVLQLPSLKYLDIRFNEFEGKLPKELFQRHIDAILINDNRFNSVLPDTISDSAVSVLVLANNKLQGCVPPLQKMASTLTELILTGNEFHSCFPGDIGMLKNLTVLDISHNQMMGRLPNEILGSMPSLEVVNVAHNMMSGDVTDELCMLPKLASFQYDYNFFTRVSPACSRRRESDDRKNCIRGRPNQRSEFQCKIFLSNQVECSSFHCASTIPSLPSPPSPKSPLSPVPVKPPPSPSSPQPSPVPVKPPSSTPPLSPVPVEPPPSPAPPLSPVPIKPPPPTSPEPLPVPVQPHPLPSPLPPSTPTPINPPPPCPCSCNQSSPPPLLTIPASPPPLQKPPSKLNSESASLASHPQSHN